MLACGTTGLYALGLGLYFLMLLKLTHGAAGIVSYDRQPQNITLKQGQEAVFTCAVNISSNYSGSDISITFEMVGNSVSGAITCNSTKEEKLNFGPRAVASCSSTPGYSTATWKISNIQPDDNSSKVICNPSASSQLKSITAFLFIQSEDKTKFLLACVLGGFLGVIVFFLIVAVIFYKRGKSLKFMDTDSEDGDDRKTTAYTLETNMPAHGTSEQNDISTL